VTRLRRAGDRARAIATAVVAGALSGVLGGASAFAFLELLDAATELRLDHAWLVWCLPAAGLVIGAAYHHLGGRAAGGTPLAVAEARRYELGAPGRMAPMILGGSLLGHVVGASVGREGVGVQMSASLTDAVARAAGVGRARRASLAQVALAGGFGGTFGTPFAGAVFALEAARRRSPAAAAGCLAAAATACSVVHVLGHEHARFPSFAVGTRPAVLGGLVAAAVAFGLTARCFVRATGLCRHVVRRLVPLPSLRPVTGGVATLVLVALAGRDHLGLSLPLLGDAFAGRASWSDPLLKLVATVLALGSGFVGGEVTPLFVVGATLGSVLADPLHLSVTAGAGLGLVAVFGAAAHVPLTCAVLAVELYGWAAGPAALAVCLLARAVAGGAGIYDDAAPDAVAEVPAPVGLRRLRPARGS